MTTKRSAEENFVRNLAKEVGKVDWEIDSFDTQWIKVLDKAYESLEEEEQDCVRLAISLRVAECSNLAELALAMAILVPFKWTALRIKEMC